MANTQQMTRALCGEHGAPLSAYEVGYSCGEGCYLWGTDIQPEPGTHLAERRGALFVAEGEEIAASEIREGDTIRHHKRRWDAATVERIIPSPYVPGAARIEMTYPSGRTATLSFVPATERFIRY